MDTESELIKNQLKILTRCWIGNAINSPPKDFNDIKTLLSQNFSPLFSDEAMSKIELECSKMAEKCQSLSFEIKNVAFTDKKLKKSYEQDKNSVEFHTSLGNQTVTGHSCTFFFDFSKPDVLEVTLTTEEREFLGLLGSKMDVTVGVASIPINLSDNADVEFSSRVSITDPETNR